MFTYLERLQTVMEYAYRDYSVHFKILSAFLFIPMVLVFLPNRILGALSFPAAFPLFGERWRSDIEFLRANDVEFLPVYTGSIVLNFILLIALLTVYVVYLFRSRKVYAVDLKWGYLFFSSIAVLGLAAACYWLFLDNDFSSSDRGISWFVDNTDNDTKFSPLPHNRIGLFIVAFLMSGICFSMMILLRILFSMFAGKRVQSLEINGGWRR